MGISVAVQVVSSRMLSNSHYGVVSLVTVSTLLVLRVHHAFVVEPALVLHPKLNRKKAISSLRDLTQVQFRSEFVILVVGLLLSLLCATRSTHAAKLFLGCTIYLVGSVGMNFRRKTAYLTGNVKASAISTIGRGLVATLTLYSIDHLFSLAPWSVLAVLGAIYSSGGFLYSSTWTRRTTVLVIRHLRYGRMSFAVQGAWGLVEASPHIIIATMGGTLAVATYQVAASLFAPLIQLGGALLLSALPNLTKSRENPRKQVSILSSTLGILFLSSIVVVLVGPQVISILYVDRYQSAGELLFYLAPTPLFLIAAHAAGMWMRAREQLRPLFYAGLFASPFMVVAVVVGYKWDETRGAALGVSTGFLALFLFTFGASLIVFKRLRQ